MMDKGGIFITSDRLPHDHGQGAKDLLAQIPRAEYLQRISSLFKQLNDSSRIRIFWILCHCEKCVLDLAALMEMSSPAVAHHLKILRTSGLIQCRRSGKEVYYKAADTIQTRQSHKTIEEMLAISCPQDRDTAQRLRRTTL